MEADKIVWRKATRSTSTGGECVELAAIPEGVGVRDSKDPHGPKILVSRGDFRRFTETLKQL
ncbi:DUF397 domain-containing protein [Spirillospora sp. NPDC047418]